MTATLSPISDLAADDEPSSRDLLARHALSLIPSILSQQDRDPHSPTYGCFDRRYWHDLAIDFPNGSAVEFVWPLALACSLPIPANPWWNDPALKEWIEAGIRYAARSAHADGSCDEHFPLEKSVSASAGSLLACVEAYSLLRMNDPEMLAFFTRRADWIAAQRKVRDVTQLALIVLGLKKAGNLLDTERWEGPLASQLERLLFLQDEEGWFPENRGADPGGHTFILGLLAQLYQLAPSHELGVALTRGLQFAADLVHPDGSFGGEYGSLGGSCFFPHGFEIAGEWLPEAPTVNDQVLAALDAGFAANSPDHFNAARRCWSWLLAWKYWKKKRPPAAARPTGRHYYKHAGLLIDRRDGCELYVALNKGGVFMLWRDNKLVVSDTHLSVQVRRGAQFATAVAGHVGRSTVHLDGHAIEIRGKLAFVDSERMSTARLVFERILMATLGRILPGLVRKRCARHIQKKKATAPFRFFRTLTWSNGKLQVRDELHTRKGWHIAHATCRGALQAGSSDGAIGLFHAGQLHPWQDFTEQMHQLKPGAPLRIERAL